MPASLTIALVGRPNVGKSTLFNRLTGQRKALVSPEPGLTRDRREGVMEMGAAPCRVLDTAGLEEEQEGTLQAAMMASTKAAMEEADILLFIFDARAGVTPLDLDFAATIRRQRKPILLIANKCESHKTDEALYEAMRLGFGEPIALSAEHGLGVGLLEEALAPYLPGQASAEEEVQAGEGIELEDAEEEDQDTPLQLAIVGRPNVGKSTLCNALLQEERVIASPVAGTTRDSVYVDWQWQDRPVRLVDTAGLRKKPKREAGAESLSATDSFHAIDYAHVVALVLDATMALDVMDRRLAAHVLKEGRALVLVVNKWDKIKDKEACLEQIRDRLETSLVQAKHVPIVTLSARTGQRLNRLMEAVFSVYAIWNRRLTTGVLNRWLEQATTRHPPPMVQGKRIRLRYITQVKTRPPGFVCFSSSAVKGLPASYLRYLTNSLQEQFDLTQVPVRLHLRKQKNPYAK